MSSTLLDRGLRAVRRPRTAAGVATIAIAATALAACSGGTPSASTAPSASQSATSPTAAPSPGAFVSWPQKVFVPYVETWTNSNLTSLASQSGVKYFNLGFLEAASPGSCTLTWNGDASEPVSAKPYLSEIALLKQQGGNVALTLGGQSAGDNGTEIADACTSVSAIAADYESLISTYHVTRLDMDVELNALTNTAGTQRRNQAIAMAQSWAASQGHTLQIQYTLPVQPSGLQPDALSVVQNAVQQGVHVTLVNLMAFDYYDLGSSVDMASAATSAAESVHSQLASLFPKDSQQQLWTTEGVTFLPGIDDDPNKAEVTSLSDAEKILDFAHEHSLGLVSMWAIERDNGGCPGSVDSDTCSGISQGTWAFSHMFEAFTS